MNAQRDRKGDGPECKELEGIRCEAVVMCLYRFAAVNYSSTVSRGLIPSRAYRIICPFPCRASADALERAGRANWCRKAMIGRYLGTRDHTKKYRAVTRLNPCVAPYSMHDGLARWRRGGQKRWNAVARWVELSAPGTSRQPPKRIFFNSGSSATSIDHVEGVI